MDNGTYAILANELFLLIIIVGMLVVAGLIVGCIAYGIKRLHTYALFS